MISPSRRIFLNIVATYGRSLYARVCGLFISRWVVAALGKWGICRWGLSPQSLKGKWYDTQCFVWWIMYRQQVDRNGKVRCSVAYHTGVERFAFLSASMGAASMGLTPWKSHRCCEAMSREAYPPTYGRNRR